MNITLQRQKSSDKSTLGFLNIDGIFECYTLEHVVRPDGEKVENQTAIPEGTYNIDITYSPHFQRYVMILEDVPGFEGIRIHTGNTVADTEGCILVGKTIGNDCIADSRLAYIALWGKILNYINDALAIVNRITIQIMDAK
jgi:hypothetical protein